MAALLSLVIPVYNEADSLEPLVAEIDAALGAAGLAVRDRLRRRRLHRRLVRRDGAARRAARRRARRQAAAQLRQGGGARARLRRVPRRLRRHARRRPPGRPGGDPAASSRRWTRATTSSRAGSRAARTRSTRPCPRASSTGRCGARPGIPLHDFNCGLKAYRREVVDTIHDLRRAAPLHPGRRRAGRASASPRSR